MKDRETFDEIIQSKFAEKEFSFDEENWEMAEKMIMTHRRKEKWKRAAFIFVVGLIVGIGSMLPFVFNLSDTSLDKLNNGGEKIANEKSIRNSSKINQTGIIVAERGVESASRVGKEKLSDIRNEELLNQLTSPVLKNRITSVPYYYSTDSKKDLYYNQINGVNNNQNQDVFNDQYHLISLEKISHAEMKAIVSSIQESSKDSLLSLLATSLHSYDSAFVVAADSNISSFESPLNTNTFLPVTVSAYLGGNAYKGFSITPYQGLQIVKPVNGKLALGIGAAYTYLSIDTGAVKKIITNTEYGFGYTSDVTEIKTSKIHYLVIPVFAQYAINTKNTVLFGANNYWLMTVTNQYSTYKESYGDISNSSSRKVFGYSSGISSYDIGILVGYNRQLSKNISVGSRVNYGLSDIKKNDYYNESTFDRNISCQLLLILKLR